MKEENFDETKSVSEEKKDLSQTQDLQNLALEMLEKKEEEWEPILDQKDQKKNMKRILPIILILILILCAIGGIYFFTQNNASSQFKKALNKGFETFDQFISKQSMPDFLSKPVLVEGDVSIEQAELNSLGLNDFTFHFNGGLDYQNQKAMFGFGLSDKNKKILNIEGFIDHTNAFLNLHDLYSKIIKVPDAGKNLWGDTLSTSMFEGISIPDIVYLLEIEKNSLIESLNKSDLTNEKMTLSINGKEIRTKKITYVFTDDTNVKFKNILINDILADEKAQKIIMNLFGLSESELKTKLEEKDDIFNSDLEQIQLYLNSSNEIVKARISLIDETTIDAEMIDDYFNIQFVETTLGKIEVLYYQNNYTIKKDNKTILELKINNMTEETLNADYTIYMDGQSVSGNLSYETSKTKDGLQGNLVVTVKLYGTLIKFKMDVDVVYDKEIKIPSDRNTINFDKLTETDYNQILNNLNKAFEGTLFEGLFTTPSLGM